MSQGKKEFLRTVKFTLFSISAGLIQIVCFALLEEVLHLTHWISYLIALVASVTWNFTLNRKFTFQSASNIPLAMLQVGLFYLVFTPLSTWWTAVLTGPEVHWNEYLVLVLTMLCNFVTEYLFERFVVFGKSLDTAEKKPKEKEGKSWFAYGVYRVIRFLVWVFYPKTQVEGLDHLPQEPCLVVGNHCQMNGPITAELYFPGKRYIWCAGQMMHLKEVPAYAFEDFWRRKSKYVRWFYKLLSYGIAPLSVCVFNNAHTVAVYRDKRILSTFRDTLKRLKEGANVIVFPEHDAPYDHIQCQFQEGFVDVARSYYKQTGKCLQFVPMYLAPALHKMYLGEAVTFDPQAPIQEERKRVCDELQKQITAIACSLPRHKVVPYNNVPRSEYGYNIPAEVKEYEKV